MGEAERPAGGHCGPQAPGDGAPDAGGGGAGGGGREGTVSGLFGRWSRQETLLDWMWCERDQGQASPQKWCPSAWEKSFIKCPRET